MTTRKKTEEVGTVVPTLCANCGQPATYRTTNPGANVDFFCVRCASSVYPGEGPELEALG